MWQKARIILDGHDEQAGVVGKYIYVQCGPPVDDLGPEHIGYRTNISTHGYKMVHVEFVELLPEFAEDVPLISWQEFLEGKK